VTEPETDQVTSAVGPLPGPQQHHWFQKVWAFVFIIFCLELGLFLVIYPWTDDWDHNLFATSPSLQLARWNEFWHNPYLKGALSGLGLLDLWVSVGEIFRLRRFSRPS